MYYSIFHHYNQIPGAGYLYEEKGFVCFGSYSKVGRLRGHIWPSCWQSTAVAQSITWRDKEHECVPVSSGLCLFL
jgi:hypothetical protein